MITNTKHFYILIHLMVFRLYFMKLINYGYVSPVRICHSIGNINYPNEIKLLIGNRY